jgi:ATP-dependent RNA helicase DeaD
MRDIAQYLPRKRQSYLFSATIPEKVRSLSRFFLREDAEFVTLSEGQLAPQEIEHFYYLCTAQEKEKLLAQIIEWEDPESAIIFCNTKADVRYVSGFLQKRGIDADQISGDLTQVAREKAIERIKAGKLRFLVATDVAARGIDISDLSHVLSYSTPESPEVYVHRTGRTGRAGKAGVAISLVSGLDIGNFRQMQIVNKIKVVERKAPTEKQLIRRTRERLTVKVEHEMRALTEAELREKIDRLIPMVEDLVKTEDGRRDLAAVCAAYLHDHRPETTVTEAVAAPAQRGTALAEEADEAASGAGPEGEEGGDRERAGERGRGRRRRGRGGSGGGGGGGGGRRRSGRGR